MGVSCGVGDVSTASERTDRNSTKGFRVETLEPGEAGDGSRTPDFDY